MNSSPELILSRHEDALMAMPNVQAVGIGQLDGDTVIKVFVTRKVPESELEPDAIVPRTLDGCRVDIEEIGIVEAT